MNKKRTHVRISRAGLLVGITKIKVLSSPSTQTNKIGKKDDEAAIFKGKEMLNRDKETC